MLFTCSVVGIIGSRKHTHSVATGVAVGLLYPVTGGVMLLLEQEQELDDTTRAGLPYNAVGAVTIFFCIAAILVFLLIVHIAAAEVLRCWHSYHRKAGAGAAGGRAAMVTNGFGVDERVGACCCELAAAAKRSGGGEDLEGQAGTLEAEFRHFDRDSDGGLNLAELEAACSSLGMRLSTEQCEKMVRDIDADRSGFVEYAEFSTFFSAARERSVLCAQAGSPTTGDDDMGTRTASKEAQKQERGFVKNAYLQFAEAAQHAAAATEPGAEGEESKEESKHTTESDDPTIGIADLKAIRSKLNLQYFVVFNTIGELLLIMVWRACTMRARRPRCVTYDHSGSSHFDRKIAQ
jgi:hypothetical protein